MAPIVVPLGKKEVIWDTLSSKYEVRSQFTSDSVERTKLVNEDNLLFVGEGGLGTSEDWPELVMQAIDRGIPMILVRPSKEDILEMVGMSPHEPHAFILIKGFGNSFCGMALSENQEALVTSHNRCSNVTPFPSGAAKGPNVVAQKPAEIQNQVIEAIEDLDRLRKKAERLPKETGDQTNTYMDVVSWATFDAMDPRGHGNTNVQHSRFAYDATYTLYASEAPNVKVLSVDIGGEGFEPSKGESICISAGQYAWGWTQIETGHQIYPADNSDVFEEVHDYVPENVSGVSTVTSGFSYGFSGGDFTAEKDNSVTKDVTDFATLTTTSDDVGMKFMNKCALIDGSESFDATGRLDDCIAGNFSHEMFNLFNNHWVRYYPALSYTLLKPNCSLYFYINKDATATVKMNSQGLQSLWFAWYDGNAKCVEGYRLRLPLYTYVDLSSVAYPQSLAASSPGEATSRKGKGIGRGRDRGRGRGRGAARVGRR